VHDHVDQGFGEVGVDSTGRDLVDQFLAGHDRVPRRQRQQPVGRLVTRRTRHSSGGRRARMI
jgi:hypothetical protein